MDIHNKENTKIQHYDNNNNTKQNQKNVTEYLKLKGCNKDDKKRTKVQRLFIDI